MSIDVPRRDRAVVVLYCTSHVVVLCSTSHVIVLCCASHVVDGGGLRKRVGDGKHDHMPNITMFGMWLCLHVITQSVIKDQLQPVFDQF